MTICDISFTIIVALSFSYAQFRIHRKLKEVAVFRYSKRVNKENGSVRIIFLAQSFKPL